MPARLFSWDAFDQTTVLHLAKRLGYSGRASDARTWLARRVTKPDERFVKETKDVLEDFWLPTYGGIETIVDGLRQEKIGPVLWPHSPAAMVNYIRSCSNIKAVRCLLRDALIDFGTSAPGETASGTCGMTVVRPFATLKPKDQPIDGRVPHPYQRKAWDALTSSLARSRVEGDLRGLVVMPTGSGKTYTVVRWLMENVIDEGGKVLWLAHRHDLLDQAASEFYRLAGFAPQRDRLGVRVVSGAHSPTSSMRPDDDIILASPFALARRLDVVKSVLRGGNRLVIVDEAHHAPASSYRKLLLDGRRLYPRLIGLTATPTRTAKDERPVLASLFGGVIIFQVSLRNLVDQRYLARPIPIRVQTHADLEALMTEVDFEHVRRFRDLGEAVLTRIAELELRNQLIVDHYSRNGNPSRYGKTLIFAIDVRHAELLRDAFVDRGVDAQYVASFRYDGAVVDRHQVVQRFQSPGSGLDVLINVALLTEGVDLPEVETVFLTRPTSSLNLFRQMIGRALRGPLVGGTPTANIVVFEDEWDRLRDWDSSIELVIAELEELTPVVEEVEGEIAAPTPLTAEIPGELIAQVARAIRTALPEQKADAFEAMPYGWYVLEREVDDELVRQVVHVYSGQLPSYQRLLDDLSKYRDLNGELLLEEWPPGHLAHHYFDECHGFLPSDYTLESIVEHFVDDGERPEFVPFAEREVCDPYRIAQKIHNSDLRRSEQVKLIAEVYESALAQAVYPERADFSAAIEDALQDIEDPASRTRKQPAVPVFDESWPEAPLSPGPAHELGPLFARVLERGKDILGVSQLPGDPIDLSWTGVVLKGRFGDATIEAPLRIRVNRLLNSPDVPATVLEFLLWHELLHVHLRAGHTKRFRELEWKWPGHVEADRFLDTLNERFKWENEW